MRDDPQLALTALRVLPATTVPTSPLEFALSSWMNRSDASMADAQNWYHSPEYQKILHLRVKNAISDLILVDGVSADFTVAGFARQVRAAIKAATGAEG